eukprot:98814_1
MPSRKRKRNRGTVAHNKRKHKKNNKNQQKCKTGKQINYNNIKNGNKELIPLYKGYIFDKYGVKYVGVLNGLSIRFYLNRNNINNIPYNIIHILKFHKIEKGGTINQQRPYGVRFLDINGNEKLAYPFEKEKKKERKRTRLKTS